MVNGQLFGILPLVPILLNQDVCVLGCITASFPAKVGAKTGEHGRTKHQAGLPGALASLLKEVRNGSEGAEV